MDNVTVREMTVDDIDEVMEIEHASFAIPWKREAFVGEVEQNNFAVYYVIEDENRIFGYCGLWMIIDEAHITNIAILPSHRGKGYGALLFGHVIEQAVEKGAIMLSLEVRVSNTGAQHMYRKFGLVPGGIRKQYYTDNGEDALVMWVNFHDER
ncbi:putative ribosomal-protein-alanine acetyltransferase [Thalassobacillus devorans]|uniref:[Ribosomal protein bS18]-alanine N-acetyltransferase n=1 Tax=Thalassobacillus devorans TaxID=279813 RepID=A0ABQ1PHM1_9BACI|nr:ribosomal protein S18-alanine N-acetyltransferase [Thalassobacillus devorans]NIK29969.1 ribosomal-protein-alanine N-acetyltransferase [Thalassobacillus devorans]GGC97268.1 putative ribosomal-protein-alanine acetyltransferase [Thalassobacillus devorans]